MIDLADWNDFSKKHDVFDYYNVKANTIRIHDVDDDKEKPPALLVVEESSSDNDDSSSSSSGDSVDDDFASLYKNEGLSYDDDDDDDFTDITTFTGSKVGYNVRFSNVEIREYACTVGDHPNAGLYPLTLDWMYTTPESISIDDYELRRHERKHNNNIMMNSRRKRCRAPRLHLDERIARLSDVTGFSTSELYVLEQKRQQRIQDERRRIAQSCFVHFT